MLGDINCLWSTIGLTPREISNLFQSLQCDKGLNNPRKLPAEPERELALAEKKLQDTHMDGLDPKRDCILVIFPFTHSPTRIYTQREDYILG